MQPRRDKASLRREAHLVLQELLDMIDRSPVLAIQQHALDAMVRLTESEVGFIYAVSEPGPTLRLENIARAGRASTLFSGAPGEESTLPGVWSPCLGHQELHIRNHPAPSTPPLNERIPPLHRDLTVPVRDGARLVAILGVGNRPVAYDEDAAALIRELSAGLGRVVVRKHLLDSMPDELK